jgi:hypothetical protein
LAPAALFAVDSKIPWNVNNPNNCNCSQHWQSHNSKILLFVSHSIGSSQMII